MFKWFQKLFGWLKYWIFGPTTPIKYDFIKRLKTRLNGGETVSFVGLGESNQLGWGPAFTEVLSETDWNCSYRTLLAAPGQTTKYMADELNNISDEILQEFFSQESNKYVVFINEGINDALNGFDETESLLYHKMIVNRLYYIWGTLGKPQETLIIIMMPAHPIDAPDNSVLKNIRNALKFNFKTVDFTDLTSYYELKAKKWYRNKDDTLHLNKDGYKELAKRVLSL